MRGDWTVTPAVAGNRTMDVVHRAVGRAGVVLVGEGVPTRVAGLIAAERKKTERVAHGVPIHEFQVGSAEGQIPVSKLQRKITTLPRTLKPAAVSDLNYRLKALQPTMQMPRGRCPRAPACRSAQAAGIAPGKISDDDRVGGPVVQAAQVTVGQAGRDHAEQEQGAQRGPPEAGDAAVGADGADAEQPLADGEAADRGEQVDLDHEQQQGGQLSVLVARVGDGEDVVPDDARGDQVAEQPVDEQRDQPPAHRGDRHRAVHRQAEPLAG